MPQQWGPPTLLAVWCVMALSAAEGVDLPRGRLVNENPCGKQLTLPTPVLDTFPVRANAATRRGRRRGNVALSGGPNGRDRLPQAGAQ
jgi:hypothetical protein